MPQRLSRVLWWVLCWTLWLAIVAGISVIGGWYLWQGYEAVISQWPSERVRHAAILGGVVALMALMAVAEKVASFFVDV